MVFAFVGGLGGPGFLSAADRAKSPLWEGRGQVSYPPRGQNRLCGRAGGGQLSYPPRIGQNRLCGRAGGPGSLSAAGAKSPLWEGWGGPGFLSAADRAKSPLEGWRARFPIRRGGKIAFVGGLGGGQVSWPGFLSRE